MSRRTPRIPTTWNSENSRRKAIPQSPSRGVRLPKYAVIENILRERVYQLQPGMQLPSEHALSRELDVSRLTLQRAMTPLVEEQILERVQGKGTFVVGKSRPRPLETYSGALENLMVYEGNASAKVLEIVRWTQTPADILDRLKLELGSLVVVFKRVAYVDREPLIYILNYLPEQFGKLLEQDRADLAKFPMVSLLRNKHQIPLASAMQTIDAVIADSVVAQHLKLEIGAPLLLVERTYFRKDGLPVQFTRSWYRTDRFKYTVSLSNWSAPPRQSKK